jgi:hypothetical protein
MRSSLKNKSKPSSLANKKLKSAKKTKTVGKKVSFAVQKPVTVNFYDPKTGEDTVATFAKSDKDGYKGFAASVESVIPPTLYLSDNGSQVMTMQSKRELVVQTYKDMGGQRIKNKKTRRVRKPLSSKVTKSKKITAKK